MLASIVRDGTSRAGVVSAQMSSLSTQTPFTAMYCPQNGAMSWHWESASQPRISTFPSTQGKDRSHSASLPHSNWRAPRIERELIERAYPGEYITVLKIGVQTKTRRYLQAIGENPDDVDSYNQVAIILARAGDAEESMNYLNKALEIDQANAAALNNRGNLYFMANDFDKAVDAYRGALAVDAEDPLVWINLAKSYRALRQTKLAKEAFGKAQALDPTMKKRYRALALELLYTL